jgi:hypothetical protein
MHRTWPFLCCRPASLALSSDLKGRINMLPEEDEKRLANHFWHHGISELPGGAVPLADGCQRNMGF